ncbi:DUF726-domain-containing protein [Infundibulicybe gibba]|nr:DUF726-domain-containing protein [Infundibulicybe gibba]
MDNPLEKITPPKDLSADEKDNVFSHIFRRLASYRNTARRYSAAESGLSPLPNKQKQSIQGAFDLEIDSWCKSLLETAWAVCQESETEQCPELDLPAPEDLSKILNAILFLHITTSKYYSPHTRNFLSGLGQLDEPTIVKTLKNPDRVVKEAQQRADKAKENHAAKGKTMRIVGMGLGAVAGGILVGVTGGLAAPLVGAGMTTVLGWLGVGGTAAGLLASGLAGSSVVCGALFGAYGARSTASMVQRHTREVRDLAIVPVREIQGDEALAVRLCVSGWLLAPQDVTEPWTIFDGDDTFALQWEVEALQELSNALLALLKSHAMKYVKAEIIKRTVFSALLSSLTPVAWLKIGQIIDNPWMNARALAIKTGAVLGDLLSKRVFGNRPVTLTGYSLGSLVIYEALKHLASLPPFETVHLIQDVFLFGTPAPTEAGTWASIRRLVSGRLVNGYSTNDYVLAVLSRASDARWSVAGLEPIEVMGVENVLCDDVDGHTKWRAMIGKCSREEVVLQEHMAFGVA